VKAWRDSKNRSGVIKSRRMSTTTHTFPDTNIVLHFPALDGLDWCGICQSDEVVIHVTQPLLVELNKVKETGGTKSVRKRAASVQRRLTQLLDTQGVSAEIRADTSVVFEESSPDLQHYPELNANISDDVLVAAILDFSARTGNTATLVTDDNGLALMVKAAKWKLKVVRPPQSARLLEEPDEDKKENEQLRHRIALLESAAPAPKLLFSNSSKVLNVDLSGDIELTLKTALAKEKEKYRPLPEPADPKPVGRLTVARLATMNDSYARLMQNDPVEVKKYNDALEEYFAAFEKAKKTNLQIKRRLIQIDLQVENTGMAPARDVLVDMHFPDGFTVLEKGESKEIFQDMPDAPVLPGHVRGFRDPMQSWMTNFPMPHNPNSPSLAIRKTNSYEVRWHVPTKLRQGYISEIDPIRILFDNAPFSFHIDYSIVADNLVDTVKGQLHVVVP
jgi:hypothetical protein